MKNFFYVNVLIILAFFGFAPYGLAATVPMPSGNASYINYAGYANAQKTFAASLDQAKKIFDEKGYDKLYKDLASVVKENAQIFIDTGQNPQDAWTEAYAEGTSFVQTEIKHEYLRQNPKNAQGYYNADNGFDGHLLLQEQGDTKNYFIEFSVMQKSGSFNSGTVKAIGNLKDNNSMQIFVVDSNGGSVIGDIMLQGDVATVTTTEAFKGSGLLGQGVVLDGKYTRVKK